MKKIEIGDWVKITNPSEHHLKFKDRIFKVRIIPDSEYRFTKYHPNYRKFGIPVCFSREEISLLENLDEAMIEEL